MHVAPCRKAEARQGNESETLNRTSRSKPIWKGGHESHEDKSKTRGREEFSLALVEKVDRAGAETPKRDPRMAIERLMALVLALTRLLALALHWCGYAGGRMISGTSGAMIVEPLAWIRKERAVHVGLPEGGYASGSVPWAKQIKCEAFKGARLH
mgnify:CR=1 FL=1